MTRVGRAGLVCHTPAGGRTKRYLPTRRGVLANVSLCAARGPYRVRAARARHSGGERYLPTGLPPPQPPAREISHAHVTSRCGLKRNGTRRATLVTTFAAHGSLPSSTGRSEAEAASRSERRWTRGGKSTTRRRQIPLAVGLVLCDLAANYSVLRIRADARVHAASRQTGTGGDRPPPESATVHHGASVLPLLRTGPSAESARECSPASRERRRA